MRTHTLILIGILVAVAATACAADRPERFGTVERPAGDRDPYRRPTIEDIRGTASATLKEYPEVVEKIVPSRETLWNFLVTAALVTVFAVLWWVFFAISLKGACWFSLVEASLMRCGFLALFITVISLICFGTAAYFYGPDAFIWAPRMPESLSLISTGIVYLLAAVGFTKLILKCKWRSVLTVWIMSTFVANAIVWCTYLGIRASMTAEAAPIP